MIDTPEGYIQWKNLGIPESISLDWPSFLSYIGLAEVLVPVQIFGPNNKIHTFLTFALAEKLESEVLFKFYDQIFVEVLSQIKDLRSINADFLRAAIQRKRLSDSAEDVFFGPLNYYEKLLVENPAKTIHDLTLYLAWDRVCINLSVLFEHQSSDKYFQHSLKVFKECLIESFQHIFKNSEIPPSFFRLLEAYYAYELREEKLQTYSEADWQTLCQSSKALRPRELLADVVYVDRAISLRVESDKMKVYTMDSADKVNSTGTLAKFAISKFQDETIGWQFTLNPTEIMTVQYDEQGFKF